MRVIAGEVKGHPLLSVPGEATRPITDRVKTALFDILGAGIEECRFLDLFGGTGSVGIEALSRGAAEAAFVEKSAAALRVLGENLRRTGLAPRANVVRGDAFTYLTREGIGPFDIIYLAPPQYQGLWARALHVIDQRPGLLTAEGLAIVQIFPKEFEDLPLTCLRLADKRVYGSTLLAFYAATGNQSISDESVTAAVEGSQHSLE